LGSTCIHWDEVCFDNEIMTSVLDDGANPLSRVTIGSLEDLGYTVDYSAADSYTTFNQTCKCNRDPASTDETSTTTTTTRQVENKTRRQIKRSLADADHPDAAAIVKAKKLLSAMIDEASTRPAADGNGSSAMMTPAVDLSVSIVTYNINTKTTNSYIITPRDLDDDILD
jgi:hypothetical protein